MEESEDSTWSFSVADEFEEPVLPPSLSSCSGLAKSSWATKAVILYNTIGSPVANGVCHCVDPKLIFGCDGPLGDHQVACQIISSLNEDDVPAVWAWSMRVWATDLTFYNGYSLKDHETKAAYIAAVAALCAPRRLGVRSYNSFSKEPSTSLTMLESKLSRESINLVASKTCCSSNCTRFYPRHLISALRDQMYRCTDWKFKNHIKLDVHRQVHEDASGKKVVTLEGIDVCSTAWRHIMEVSKTTFYNKRQQVLEGVRAGHHGNLGSNKSREHMVQATATMRVLLKSAADQMPHKSKTLASSTKIVSKMLPSNWRWNSVLLEVNNANLQLGLPPISQSGLSKIRRVSFSEFASKSPGDNFARCSICDKYNPLEKASIPGSKAEEIWKTKLHIHKSDQRTHRELYYANRYRSVTNPTEVLTFIHDKMDHAKTALPLFSHKTKMNNSCMKLPVAITGIIAHGHGDVRYAHYGLDLYPSDCNHTVGSIAKLLRDLEEIPKTTSRELFSNSESLPFFQAILVGKECCVASLPPPPIVPVEPVKLPPILNVQLDNAASDNKNRFMFCFWSLLVAKRIFRKIYVNFMLVGHTHDDIDALFGRWSMKLRQNDFPTIPSLMKSFMDVESETVIPHLIEEVPDFKSFIKPYIADGDKSLVGHSEAQQFKFFVHDNSWPMMQYKIKCTDSEWLPLENGGIKLWKEDSIAHTPLLPSGQPVPLQPSAMRNLEEIIKELGGFVANWKDMCKQDASGEYRRKHGHLISYWEAVRANLSFDNPITSVLQDGFWPKSRISVSDEDHFTSNGFLREEYADDAPFVGRRCDRPEPSFRVGRDLYAGYFIVICPAEGDTRPFWIARALTDYNIDANHANMVEIQYYMPTSKSQVVQKTYQGWDSKRPLQWKVNDSEDPVWLHSDSIMSSWKSNARIDARRPIVSITAKQILVIRQSLAQYEDK